MPEIAQIGEHLLLCDSCRERLKETALFALSMREVLKSQPLTGEAFSWFGWLRPQFAVAGAFVIVLLAAGIYRMSGDVRMNAVASLRLTAMRGSTIQTVSAARELELSVTDAPPLSRLDVVDARGATVWTGTLTPADNGVHVKIARLSPGDYFARAYMAPDHVLHEYGFRVVR
jgi:hypothetical protein